MRKSSTLEGFIVVKFSEKYKLSSIADETTIPITTEKESLVTPNTKLQVHICIYTHFTIIDLEGGACHSHICKSKHNLQESVLLLGNQTQIP